jgi:hypothetical protein
MIFTYLLSSVADQHRKNPDLDANLDSVKNVNLNRGHQIFLRGLDVEQVLFCLLFGRKKTKQEMYS